jgi:hypothetical protein
MRKEEAILLKSHYMHWGSERIETTLDNEKKRSRTMTTSHDRGSAEIYQFPPRGRFALDRRDESKAAASIASTCLATIAFSGSWYHEEAIQEAERARKS